MSELSTEQKLVWLGLRQPTRQSSDGGIIVSQLKDAFGDSYSDFKDPYETDNPADFGDFETFLSDNGVSDPTAIRDTFETKYDSFSAFDTDIRSFTSYVELETSFTSGNEFRSDLQTDDGFAAAGIKVYESAGVGKDGQSIPQGGIELWGDEIHTSQSTANVDTDGPGDTDGNTTYEFDYSSLSISDTTPVPDETITVSCDVANQSTQTRDERIQLFVDGVVYDSKWVTVFGADVETVSFDWSSSEYKSVDIGIGPLSPQSVTVVHPNLNP